MKLVLFVICAMLSGCAMTDNLATYDAVVATEAQTYRIHNKHGSLLVVEEADGTKITADDRGHPQEQGMLGKLVEYATVKAAGDID